MSFNDARLVGNSRGVLKDLYYTELFKPASHLIPSVMTFGEQHMDKSLSFLLVEHTGNPSGKG